MLRFQRLADPGIECALTQARKGRGKDAHDEEAEDAHADDDKAAVAVAGAEMVSETAASRPKKDDKKSKKVTRALQ